MIDQSDFGTVDCIISIVYLSNTFVPASNLTIAIDCS